jgi:hypothetical protein
MASMAPKLNSDGTRPAAGDLDGLRPSCSPRCARVAAA